MFKKKNMPTKNFVFDGRSNLFLVMSTTGHFTFHAPNLAEEDDIECLHAYGCCTQHCSFFCNKIWQLPDVNASPTKDGSSIPLRMSYRYQWPILPTKLAKGIYGMSSVTHCFQPIGRATSRIPRHSASFLEYDAFDVTDAFERRASSVGT